MSPYFRLIFSITMLPLFAGLSCTNHLLFLCVIGSVLDTLLKKTSSLVTKVLLQLLKILIYLPSKTIEP